MGDILPFIARIQSEGGWTAPERASLQALAEQLAEKATPVEVSFGASDSGDPWCVVTDEDAEVLIHVARIGARIVVHYAADDVLAEAPDLRTALAQRLPTEGRAGFKAANDDGREAQILIALVVGAAFAVQARTPLIGAGLGGETGGARFEGEAAPAEAAAPCTPPEIHRAAASDAPHAPPEPTHARSGVAAAQAAQTLAISAAIPVAGLAGEPAGETAVWRMADSDAFLHFETGTRILGTSGDDVLVGGPGADLVVGGAGADTISGGGAPEGAWDTLMGGEGDDHLYLDPSTLAVGGAGADTFLLRAGMHNAGPQKLLGAIQDFKVFEGDRLLMVDGRAPGLRFGEPIGRDALKGLNVADRVQAPDGTGRLGGPAHGGAPTTPSKPADGGPQTATMDSAADADGPVTVLQVDLDGDGVADGYIAVLNRLSGEERAAILGHGGHVTGAALDPPDVF